MEFQCVTTCPSEVQEILQQELFSLGASNVEIFYKAIGFRVNESDFYRCHLKLACASNIFLQIESGFAKDLGKVADLASKVRWSEHFAPQKTYKVDVQIANRKQGTRTFTANELSKTIRLAIEHAFHSTLGEIPKVDLEEPDVVVSCFFQDGNVTFGFNTSKKALHKRGYRSNGHEAPLKETLAAAILRIAGYDGSQVFLDPMCGSGTLAIEAAYIAMDKACNIHRKKGQFGFEHLRLFNNDLFRKIKEELKLQKLEAPQNAIYAKDINADYVELAKANALRARVERYLTFSPEDFFQSQKPAEKGILVTNMPFGARLNFESSSSKDSDLKSLYQEVGNVLKRSYSGWKAFLFVGKDTPWKFIGLKPSKKIPLFNGAIPCYLLQFDLYDGSRRAVKGHG